MRGAAIAASGAITPRTILILENVRYEMHRTFMYFVFNIYNSLLNFKTRNFFQIFKIKNILYRYISIYISKYICIFTNLSTIGTAGSSITETVRIEKGTSCKILIKKEAMVKSSRNPNFIKNVLDTVIF